ncbi:MAG: aminodeoxyfutalosine synthase [Bacteroidia bacterium]|nr:MAG: aminodeoxyfutalosine synthase [Bacteroidia bacterium]
MQSKVDLVSLINNSEIDNNLKKIAEKVLNEERISTSEAIILYEKGELGYLGVLANYIREKKNGNFTYFNRNFHIEPTNLCVFDCKFCSYSRNFKQKGDAWEMTEEEIYDYVRKYDGQPVTEVHIVGGVHPKLNLEFFARILRNLREIRPDIHRKGFTAVELEYMFRKAKVSIKEGLEYLKENGLQSLPGGGAEIFDEAIRNEICADKCDSKTWLEIHETAHKLGMPSNATMLYGHIETYAHRVDHMNRLRELQDRTGGFNTFIPLKFRNQENQMSHIPEVSTIEDLRNYAVARIFMDNFQHIKAYWPMIGRETAALSMSIGVDDIDGTIDDSTKIYTMAGSEEQTPALSTQQLVELIKTHGRHPIERDTLYNTITDYANYVFDEKTEVAAN